MNSNIMELRTFESESIETLQTAKTQEELSLSIEAIINQLGFSKFDIFHTDNGRYVKESLTMMPDSLLDTYHSENMQETDLAIEFLHSSPTDIFYSDIYKYLSESPVRIKQIDKALQPYELMRIYDLYDIYCCPVKNARKGGKTIFSVLVESENPKDFRKHTLQHRQKIKSLAKIVNHQIFQAGFKSNTENKYLTDKEKIVLEALSKFSLTQQQAADYLHMSVRTIEKHCENIRGKLNKSTLLGAFYEAVSLGEIFVDT